MTRQRLTRSENMARIRSRDTKPEIRLRQALWAAGCRYRLRSDLPGSPDILFVKARVAVFVDGCFWHGCPLHYSAPRTREEFWKTKLRKNVLRDIAADDALVSDKWEVFRVWEHELKDTEDVVRRIQNLLTPKLQHIIQMQRMFIRMSLRPSPATDHRRIQMPSHSPGGHATAAVRMCVFSQSAGRGRSGQLHSEDRNMRN